MAKYGGYAATLWVTLSHWGLDQPGPLWALLAVIGVDSIRSFFVESRHPGAVRVWLWMQWALVGLFLWLDTSGIGSIPYIILIAESQLSDRQVGVRIFLASLLAFLLIGNAVALQQGVWSAERFSTLVINALFFVFAFGVSYLVRVQQRERERAEAALADLQRSQSELQEAHQQLMERAREAETMAMMRERQRMARDIHDTLAHSLTGIIVGLEACKRLLTQDPSRAEDGMNRIQEQARSGLEELRRLVKDWKPLDLETAGFEAALRSLGREMRSHGVTVQWDLIPQPLPSFLEVPFYRVTQEALTNSLRHGGARQVNISLHHASGLWQLEIEDDGYGAAQIQEGYGLRGMRERLEEVGGRIHFEGREPRGFLVRAEVEVSDDHTHSDRR